MGRERETGCAGGGDDEGLESSPPPPTTPPTPPTFPTPPTPPPLGVLIIGVIDRGTGEIDTAVVVEVRVAVGVGGEGVTVVYAEVGLY